MIEIVKIYTSKAVWYFEIKINKQSIKEKDFADHTVFYTKKDAKKCLEDNNHPYWKFLWDDRKKPEITNYNQKSWDFNFENNIHKCRTKSNMCQSRQLLLVTSQSRLPTGQP